jgi:ferredoxin
LKKSDSSAMTYRVSITNTREVFACSGAQTLLGAMEALGHQGIPVGCRGGGCGVCKLRVDSGSVRCEKMSRACVSVAEQSQGFVLACRSRPITDVTVTAVDRLARCIQRGFERRPAASFLARATGELLPNHNNEGDSTWR